MAAGPGSAASSSSRGGTSTSPPTSGRLFGEVAVRHLGVPVPAPLFPGFALSAQRFPGVIA